MKLLVYIMSLEDENKCKNSQKSIEFRNTLESCFFLCGKKANQKNLHKCQMLELHNQVKNAAQNLNYFKLIAKLS